MIGHASINASFYMQGRSTTSFRATLLSATLSAMLSATLLSATLSATLLTTILGGHLCVKINVAASQT